MEKKINKLIKEKNKTNIPLTIQERARRLRFLRKMARLSMKEFAEHCNLGLTTINYWEQGYSSITERGAKKVSEAMRGEGIECSSIWLLSGLGAPPKITDPSKLSKINYYAFDPSAQTIQEENSSYLNEKFKKELELFQTIHPENLVYCINDDGMVPLYCKGDMVAGKKLTGEDMQLANSIDCIVEIEKNKFVRRVRIGHSTNGFDLYVINSEASLEFPPLRNVKINSLAPIMRIWKPLKF
ncbi:MAG: helix-turn-helix transcriptional regulator [Rickettsiella sp.]|nr:helix-turn-helix transcriptional regulator [Rickettsiella sp.]